MLNYLNYLAGTLIHKLSVKYLGFFLNYFNNLYLIAGILVLIFIYYLFFNLIILI